MPRITLVDIGSALARIEAQQQATAERVGRIEDKIDAAPTMRDLDPLIRRIAALETVQAWVIRSIVAGFVAAIAAVIAGSRMKLGAVIGLAGLALTATAGEAYGDDWRITDERGTIAIDTLRQDAPAQEGRRTAIEARRLVVSAPPSRVDNRAHVPPAIPISRRLR